MHYTIMKSFMKYTKKLQNWLRSDELGPNIIGDEVTAVWLGETWNGKNDKHCKKNNAILLNIKINQPKLECVDINWQQIGRISWKYI